MFSEDQIGEFQEAFLLYDSRGDGKIPVSQIGDVMRALGQVKLTNLNILSDDEIIQNPTESEVKKLVVEHRADDRVTFEQFLPIMQVRSKIDGVLRLKKMLRQSVPGGLLTLAMTLSRVSVTLTKTGTDSLARRSSGTC